MKVFRDFAIGLADTLVGLVFILTATTFSVAVLWTLVSLIHLAIVLAIVGGICVARAIGHFIRVEVLGGLD